MDVWAARRRLHLAAQQAAGLAGGLNDCLSLGWPACEYESCIYMCGDWFWLLYTKVCRWVLGGSGVRAYMLG